jgi:serine/threonine protein kinase
VIGTESRTAPVGSDQGSRPIAPQRLLSGRYELGTVLGRGGMSEVRRGLDTVLLRPVAIKLLIEGDRTSVARFEREARVLANLQHPNVVSVFDFGTDGDDRYIVMELVEGPTLRDLLNEGERLEPDRAAPIGAGVATALAYAHDRDVVHRDVKPSNVLMASGDRVKLADLGIAKLLNAETLAMTSGVLGTAHYISPEQVQGDPVDGRADLYSLGCVLFEMLVGRPPFKGDMAALTYAHVHTPAPRPRSLEPSVPESLDDLVASLMEKEPSRRPQTAAEVGAALRRTPSKAPTHAAIEAPPGDGDRTMQLLPEPPEPRVSVEPASRVEPVTTPAPVDPAGPNPPPAWRRFAPGAAAGIIAFLLLMLLALLFVRDPTPNQPASARSPHASAPARSETQTSPPTSSEPSPQPPSPRQAGQHVVDVVNAGIAAGEITGGIVGEVDHTIDEVFKELEEHHDVGRALEKVAELRDKVGEALDKGEIASSSRAQAITESLDELAVAIQAQA